MGWDSYFSELEGQFADDAAAERARVEGENERVRQAHIDLLTRLRAMAVDKAHITVTVAGPQQIAGTITVVGADWCGVDTGDGDIRCVRSDAIERVSAANDQIRRSLLSVPADGLAARATFGYVLRGFARRRTPVLVQFTDATVATGTIDRAGRDHCDLALHDAHTSRRDDAVSRVVVVPFSAIAAVSPLGGGGSLIG